MDLSKLKIDDFSHIVTYNFPEKYALDFDTVNADIDVIMYFIDVIEDVKNFVEYCENTNLAQENRVIMVYEKGRKNGVNRDSIFAPFKDGIYTGYKMKAPMLCSLSDKLSAFVQQKVLTEK